MKKANSLLIRRIAARLIDYLLIYMGSSLFFTWPPLALIALPLLFIPFEIIFTKLFATTPGKACFGLRVTTPSGEKLSWAQSAMRGLLKNDLLPVGIIRALILLIRKKDFLATTPFEQTVTQVKKGRRSFLIGAAALTLSIGGATYMSPIGTAIQEQGAFIHNVGLDSSWKSVDIDEFTIKFPKKPEETATEIPISGEEPLEIREHKVESREDIVYSVSYTNLPKSALKWKDGLILKGVSKIIAKHLNLSLLEKQLNYSLPHPALDFVMQKGSRLIKGRLILIDGKLYKVEVSYPQDQEEKALETAQAFINSFKI